MKATGISGDFSSSGEEVGAIKGRSGGHAGTDVMSIGTSTKEVEGEKGFGGVNTIPNGKGDTPDSDAHSAQQGELQRQLSGRHLNFIAIGGTIGTGFFLGTGTALVKAGPAGCLISYVFVGTILWSVMVCLGELATYIPTAGAFSAYATRFVDASLGFAVGWLYWFGCEFSPRFSEPYFVMWCFFIRLFAELELTMRAQGPSLTPYPSSRPA